MSASVDEDAALDAGSTREGVEVNQSTRPLLLLVITGTAAESETGGAGDERAVGGFVEVVEVVGVILDACDVVGVSVLRLGSEVYQLPTAAEVAEARPESREVFFITPYSLYSS